MNKFFTVLMSILGAFNVVFSMFIPIAVGLLLMVTFETSKMNTNILFTIALLATLYRGIKYLMLE